MTRVLIVDDHPVARGGIQAVIATCAAGAEFAEASDVPVARELLEREGWDLLVLDLGLPPPGGLGLLQEVRRRWPALRVLVVSAFAETEYAVFCMKLGASGYVSKTSGPTELGEAAQKVLSGRRYISPAVAEHLASSVALSDAPANPWETLSGRELQVLRAVATGLSSKQIAADLDLAERTIGTYRARIAVKLGLNTAVEITRYALKHRLVD